MLPERVLNNPAATQATVARSQESLQLDFGMVSKYLTFPSTKLVSKLEVAPAWIAVKIKPFLRSGY